MKFYNIKNNQGYSLINILIAVAIMGMVTYQISSFFDSSEKAQRKKDAKENAAMDLGLLISSINKVTSMATYISTDSSDLEVPIQAGVDCKDDLQKCIGIMVETYDGNKIDVEEYQFGTRCISPTPLIKKLKKASNDMITPLKNFVNTNCGVSCGSNQIPIAVLYHGGDTKTFPPSEPNKLTDTIGTAICFKDKDDKGMIKVNLLAFSLDRTAKKTRLRGTTRTLVLDYISKASTMNIVDEK